MPVGYRYADGEAVTIAKAQLAKVQSHYQPEIDRLKEENKLLRSILVDKDVAITDFITSREMLTARIEELEHKLKRGCVDCEDAIRADERTKTLREVGEWIEKIAELEQCDPSVMAYFEDYYWVGRTEFESILAQLKSGNLPQEEKK
jgi:predicted  nucleic acid-binding Zn-ribbon protein